jgi:hypothetical protein
MYISPRAALVRNSCASVVSGAITLIILLIAPLGLLAVMINTLLVTIATFTVAVAIDRVTLFLQSSQQAELLSKPEQFQIQHRKNSNINRQR